MNDPAEFYEDEVYTEEEYDELPVPTIQPTHIKRTKITAVPVTLHDYEGFAFWKVRPAISAECCM
jgi:hypothetical protein